jgi:hypothetical protein
MSMQIVINLTSIVDLSDFFPENFIVITQIINTKGLHKDVL